MAVTIICAGRRAGKTTYLRRYMVELGDRGRSVGGIASPAVFEGGQRIGYDLLDLRRGTRRPLARVTSSAEVVPTVGIYQFDSEVIKEGNEAICAAVRDRLEVVAIDEVGPLEFRGGGWAPALETALNTCTSAQQLVVVVRPVLVDELPGRFPSSLWTGADRVSPPWPAQPGP